MSSKPPRRTLISRLWHAVSIAVPARWKRSKVFVVAVVFGLALSCLLGGYVIGHNGLIMSGGGEPNNGRIKLKPGPWGDVEYLPITIAPPRKLLRVKGLEEETLYWYFTGASRASISDLLVELDVPESLRRSMTSAAVLSEHPEGARMEPTCDMIQGLNDNARNKLYQILASEPLNNSIRWEFLSTFTDNLSKFGVSRRSKSSLEAVSTTYGRFTVTYSMPCVLRGIEEEEEKVGLIKALSQQNSMLVRLRITPKTDVQKLAEYWGRGMWSTDVEAILESVKQRPDGGSINILEVLPPLAGALLHSYPTPHNFMSGPEVIKNCSWTALNFFRDTPRPEFSDEDVVLKTFAEDYLPVLSDPSYGDIAVFLTPQRTMQHVAVFLADDLYFTKNGNNPWHPWVYSNERDLMEAFSFGLPEGQELSIHYFRSKTY